MKEESHCHENKTHKIRLIFFISLFTFLALIVAALIFIISKLKDTNRNTYQSRGIEHGEIIKKNYINGFKETETTGKFSYTLPAEDINELLSNGVESIDDKYREYLL